MENSFKVKRLFASVNKLAGFAYTTLFCLGIAVLLYVLEVTDPFSETLIISLSIGWSIRTSLVVFSPIVGSRLPAYVTAVLLTAAGLALGLGIAGLLNESALLAYFSGNYASMILGVFFAIVGVAVFQTHGRLASAKAALAEADVVRQKQEKALLSAELKLLQAQIEPHFLFNTLSNVVGLIHVDPAAAEKTLLNLTTLLRSSLNRTREASVTLAEEMAIVRAYLEIQAIRMSGRLEFQFEPSEHEMEKTLLNWPLPPLLVQPLVENAIKHGIDPSETGGSVIIKTKIIDTGIQIEIIDTGIGIDPNRSDAGGSGLSTGLSNVRGRLQALYGAQASLALEDNEPSGLKVTLKLPGKLE